MEDTLLIVNTEKSLAAIHTLLRSLTRDDWHRPQGDKWTIAQEVEHLRLSTQGAALVLSPRARAGWYPFAGESRSFDAIVAQYQNGLASAPGVNNAPTRPTDESAGLTLAQQTENWTKATQALLASIAALTPADLDAYTVWKHPLLGPLTVREMIYFTIHHTDHHYASLCRKQTAPSARG